MPTRQCLLYFVFVWSVACGAVESNTSKLWTQFVKQKKAGETTWLPDFSYAGYKRGEEKIKTSGLVFNVTDYGAFPDDLKDDYSGIAKAVEAAKKNGGGIVFMPKGRYLVNTSMDNRKTIKIDSDNIVLKGEGNTRGGTVIHSIHPYGGGDPHRLQRLHLGRNVLLIHSRKEESSLSRKKVLCKVTADIPRETFYATVGNTKNLKVDDYVYLYALNNEIHKEMIKPYTVDKKWTTILRNRAYTVEMHKIKSISGNRVEFYEPVRYDVKKKHNWVLKECKPVKNIGVEDICFMGNSYHRYKHHRSGMDDSGWSFIKIKCATDSWVRRYTFINCNQTVYVAMSSSISILNIIVAGNKGHHTPRFVYFPYGVLGGFIEDRAGFDHGPSLSWGAVANVFWRCKSKGSVDAHSGRPYANLFDNITGGRINSSGGVRDYPQHLRFMVIWNFNHDVTEVIKYDFWKKGKNNAFVKPIISGWHGKKAEFVDYKNKLEVLESLGKSVKPDSLYEAQLKLRLGRLPKWIDEAKNEYKELSKKELPEYYDRNSEDQKAFMYREVFKVDDMLKYLTSLSLQMFRSVQFSYAVPDKELTLDTDQGFVRNTLYSLMNCIYKYTRRNNSIKAEGVIIKGKKYVSFTVKSGSFKKPVKDLSNDPHCKDAVTFARKVHGTVKTVKSQGLLEFKFILPQKLK